MTTVAPDVTTPAGLIRLGNAFCESKALLTAVELDLFTTLHGAPKSCAELREALDLNGRGLSDFLDLLVSLGLLENESGVFANTPTGDSYLVRSSDEYIGGFLNRTNHTRFPAWSRLTAALRTGEQQSPWKFDELTKSPALLAGFIGMMDSLTSRIGPELVSAYDFASGATVTDVGGCRGSILAQIVQAHPHLTGHLFDVPAMADPSAELMSELGLTDRVVFHPGDFFVDELPPADIVVIGHVLHDWGQDQRAALIEKCFTAVNPGGSLLVYDRMLDDGPNRIENLAISLDMLLVTDHGEEYPAEEIHARAAEVGFVSSTQRPLGDFDTLVICTKA